MYTDMKRQCLKLSISIRGRKLNSAIDAKEESVIEAKNAFYPENSTKNAIRSDRVVVQFVQRDSVVY